MKMKSGIIQSIHGLTHSSYWKLVAVTFEALLLYYYCTTKQSCKVKRKRGDFPWLPATGAGCKLRSGYSSS